MPYFVFGAVKRITRFSAKASATVTFFLILGLPYGVVILREHGMLDELGTLTASTGDEDSHFKGRTAKNTSQKEMNELMEGWE
ncbi:hypothetical protein [Kordiimonas gwangyangensis]|uniref:hypothetical protein n=1 Tax=Kordiimonas gwangyangensis TaxID=288022 RepID=UPI00046FE31F|nr:hypothetical protein [Kordiimonas gwangyangensis]